MGRKVMKSMKAKTAMKAVAKAMKAMKAMKAKVRGRKWQVLAGTRVKTNGGLEKGDLIKNKRGKVVSKKASQRSKSSPWMKACGAARKALGITGFAVIGGATPQGKALYAKAKSIYAA